MTVFLVEMDAVHARTGAPRTYRFASAAFTTAKGDVPARATFRTRLTDPGNFERHMFGQGRTFGEPTIGFGEIVLNNADGDLDDMLDHAFDGRGLRIFAVEDKNSPWASRQTVLVGTMEQPAFDGRRISMRLRDRLELLREPIQTTRYLGTTTSGSMAIAEGNADLKDTRKAQLWGYAENFQPVLVDQFDNIYHLGTNAVAAVHWAKDDGVALTYVGDFATLALAKAATKAIGHFSTCNALGYLRTHQRPDGTLTVCASEGATPADRSAARIARRMIGALGTVAEETFAALHALAPAECGVWLPPGETTVLAAATTILSAARGYLQSDRFGAFQVGRLDLPAGPPKARITRNRILSRGEGFARQPTLDIGDGVPSWQVTVEYGQNYTVRPEADLKDVASTDPFRTFSALEFRKVTVDRAATKERHLKSMPLTFRVPLRAEADARALAQAFLEIHGSRRDFFEISVSSAAIAGVDLGDVVELAVPRYGLDAGRLLRVIGITPMLQKKTTTLGLWG